MKKFVKPIRSCADCINRTLIFESVNKTIKQTYRCNLFQYKCKTTGMWYKDYIYNCRKDENKCGAYGRYFISEQDLERMTIIHDKYGNVIKNNTNANANEKPIIDI